MSEASGGNPAGARARLATGGDEQGGERLRLFVALELPEPARRALVDWRSEAVGAAGGLRLIDPRDLHATLCFLGWRGEREVGAILAACAAVAREVAPELRLGQAIWLPPRRPRVLAVAVEDPSRQLARVQSLLAAVLAAGGWYEPERRPYLGHVTVARVSRGARPPRTALPAPPPVALRADRVTLYRSLLSRAGARYQALGGVVLAGAEGRDRP